LVAAGMPQYLGLSDTFSEALRQAFRRDGWTGVQIALLLPEEPTVKTAPGHRQLRDWLDMALLESLVFPRFGFGIAWCEQGRHWYVCGDARQKDCPPHNLAGEKARWRKRKEEKERGAARQATLRKSDG
jgi:hypothetical protein